MSEALFDLPAPAPDPVVVACPVGTTVTAAYGRFGLGSASFDATHTYRFRLSRVWDRHRPRCCFIMLNPSTADERVADPTVRRCLGFARGWGFGGVEVVNLYAFRTPRPSELFATADPVGPANDRAILAAAGAADLTVAAWGVEGARGTRADDVRRLLAEAGVDLCALRLTKDGHPGHPLYVPASAKPMLWPPDRA